MANIHSAPTHKIIDVVCLVAIDWDNQVLATQQARSKVHNAELVSKNIKGAFIAPPNWKQSENALQELRKKVTFAIFAEVDQLFTLLEGANRL